MTEKEFFYKIKTLQEIKPRKDWVALVKRDILGENDFGGKGILNGEKLGQILYFPKFIFQKKLGYYAFLTPILILIGVFSFAQKSVPGDFLYIIKKMTEAGQTFFVSEKEDTSEIRLELAQKRLDELVKIIERNQSKKLSPAIKEFQASVSKIETLGFNDSSMKKLVGISKKAKELESRGVVIGKEKLQKLELVSLVNVLEHLVLDLENRTLTEKQQELLVQMKNLIEEEKYLEALELYLANNN